MAPGSSMCRIAIITLLPFVMIFIIYHGLLYQSITNTSPPNGTPNDNEFIDLKLESEPLPSNQFISKFYCGTLDFALHSLLNKLTYLHVIEPHHISIKVTPYAIESCGDKYITYILRDCKLNSFLNGHLNLGFTQVRNIDPRMVLSLFIPGLIFESAFHTNYHIFLKEAQQAAMLAGPGVVVNALLIGGVMHYFAHSISLFSSIDTDGYDWSWSFSIMFGSIVSATDPIAVVALLKELGASKRLSTLIEAESLLNDGATFVLFIVLKLCVASPANITAIKINISDIVLVLSSLLVNGQSIRK